MTDHTERARKLPNSEDAARGIAAALADDFDARVRHLTVAIEARDARWRELIAERLGEAMNAQLDQPTPEWQAKLSDVERESWDAAMVYAADFCETHGRWADRAEELGIAMKRGEALRIVARALRGETVAVVGMKGGDDD